MAVLFPNSLSIFLYQVKQPFAFKKETNKLVRNVMRILTRFQMANFWRNP